MRCDVQPPNLAGVLLVLGDHCHLPCVTGAKSGRLARRKAAHGMQISLTIKRGTI